MNKLILLLCVALAGCASTDKPNHARQIELSSEYGATLCRGDVVTSFIETTYYHAITCKDGSYFFLKREDR